MADVSLLVQPTTSTDSNVSGEHKNFEIQAVDDRRCYCYLDDCFGILQGIPNSFDLGTISVRLTCISVSPSYVAIGSSCGALFLYNRRLNKNVNPLRTSFKEIVTCIELFHTNEDDFLAIGHRSGTVILLCLPSNNPNGNRKIIQSIEEDAHKGQSIVSMVWNRQGTKLFTADLNGLVMVTEVDFSAETYNCLFVYNESRPIVQLVSLNDLLAFCTTEKFHIFDSTTNHLIFEASNFNCDIQDIFAFRQQLSVLTSDGKIFVYEERRNNLEAISDLHQLSKIAQSPRNSVVNGRIFQETKLPIWTLDDFCLARVKFLASSDSPQLVLTSSEKIMLCDLGTQEPECFVYDLEFLLNDEIFEIIDFACNSSEEIFILTSTKRLLRLSKHPAQVSMIFSKAPSLNGLNILSSFTEAAQKSTNMFEKFKKTDEFERLKQFNFRRLGISSQISNMTEQLKNSSNIEQTGKVFASNLFNFIDNKIKGSALVTELPQSAQNLLNGHHSFTSPTSSQSSSPPSQTVFEKGTQNIISAGESSSSREHSYMEPDFLETMAPHPTPPTTTATEVTVKRKNKTATKKKFLQKISPYKVENDVIESVVGETNPIREEIMKEENVDKILRVIGMINGPETSEENQIEFNGEFVRDNKIEQSTLEEDANMNQEIMTHNKIEEKSNSIGYAFQEEEENIDICNKEPYGLNQEHNYYTDEEPTTSYLDENSPECESDLEDMITKTYTKMREENNKNEKIHFLDDAELIPEIEHPESTDTIVSEQKSLEYMKILSLGNHQTDMWNNMQLPYDIHSFDVSSSYIVITSKKSKHKPQFLPFNNIDSGVPGGEWVQTNFNATSYAVNDKGNLLWRIEKGIAYAPLQVNPKTPKANEWVEQTASQVTIQSVALTSKHAWYLTNKGVFVQMNLPEMGILFHAECPFQLASLTACDHAVWGIRDGVGSLVVRVGLDKCPMGYDWVEDCLAGPRRFISVALYEKSGWALDPNGVLWFNNNVQEVTPFGVGDWFQVCAPMFISSPNAKKFLPISKWQLKVCSTGVFLHVGKVILVTRQPLTGHRFPRAVPERMSVYDNFSLISSGAYTSANEDHICVCQPNSEIFLYSIWRKNFMNLPGFSQNFTIKSLTAVNDSLYVLDSNGKVYYRKDLSNISSSTQLWLELSKEQFDEDIKVLSIAVSTTTIWILTNDGMIWSRNSNGDSNWKGIDRPKISLSEPIDQIRTSISGNFVWIFSTTSGRSWARIGISKDDSKGRGWSEASNEIKVIDLAIGEKVVWALSSTNHLYRLRCLSEGNPVGLLWKSVPVQLKTISVDGYENRLWGLDMKNRIVKHEMDIYPRNCLTSYFIEKPSLDLLENSENVQNQNFLPMNERDRKGSNESDFFAPWNDDDTVQLNKRNDL